MSRSFAQAQSLSYLFKRQGWHLGALLVLIPVTWILARGVLGDASWLRIQDVTWFRLAVGIAVAHQIVVWLGWRLQLGWAVFSKVFGQRDLSVWTALFFLLLIARPLFIIGLAMADRGTLGLATPLAIVIGVLLLIPPIYTFYSTIRYFGLRRAIGGDHFREEYRNMPLVSGGAFAWSGNAMYAFGFLGLWAIGFLLQSQAALSVAFFQHAYIWVHYYCTEHPDMELLYGGAG